MDRLRGDAKTVKWSTIFRMIFKTSRVCSSKCRINAIRADYDPDEVSYKSEVLEDMDEAEDILSRFQKVPVKYRRAFAVYVLLELRKD